MQGRIELTRSRRLKTALKWRALQPVLMLLLLAFFVVAILTGFFGTPAGSHNFGIIFVWIVWWALLIIVMVPFFGRLWCAICPIPGPGEWLQRLKDRQVCRDHKTKDCAQHCPKWAALIRRRSGSRRARRYACASPCPA